MANEIVAFEEDIKGKIFTERHRNEMLKIGISVKGAVVELDLWNYDSVKFLNERITIALHGWEPGRESSHRMPPGAPLPKTELDTWDAWVAGGMVRSRAPLA